MPVLLAAQPAEGEIVHQIVAVVHQVVAESSAEGFVHSLHGFRVLEAESIERYNIKNIPFAIEKYSISSE